MIRFYLYLVFFQFLFALNFDFTQNVPQVIINNEQINNGFLGGLNYAITRWVDWDNDNDSDLFVLDEDGHIRYYENTGSNSEKIYANEIICCGGAINSPQLLQLSGIGDSEHLFD